MSWRTDTAAHPGVAHPQVYFVYTKLVFEWDPRKAASNLAKHGVSFEEATTVFGDPGVLDGPDLGHSEDEARCLRLGRSILDRVLMVAYTEEEITWRGDPHHQRAASEPQRT